MNEHRTEEAGIALPLVLAVLVCLLAVGIPFSLSMRNEQGSATYRAERSDARREADLLQEFTVGTLASFAPDRDPTPYYDSLAEIQIDVTKVASELSFEDLGPKGRLWSASVEDLSARIDLNSAPLQVIARGLALSSPLARKLKPEDTEIRVSDGDAFRDSGFLWIQGEVTHYGRKDGSTLYDLVRPAVVPGLWEPQRMSMDSREHEAGTEVIDFRAYLIATELFRAGDGVEKRFESTAQAASIARYGVGALGPLQKERLARLFTVYASDNARYRWVNPQRVFGTIIAGESTNLEVETGQYIGPGSLVRVTTDDGDVDYGIVTASAGQGRSSEIKLDLELRVSAEPYSAIVETQYRRPINVNTCSPEMLELLLRGLKRSLEEEINALMAHDLATRLIASRPLAGPATLRSLLDGWVNKDRLLSADLARLVYTNASQAASRGIGYGTLPFSYVAEGVFDVKTAASLNHALSGREKARSFVHQVLCVPGSGLCSRLFLTQRDFDEPWRHSRRARGWATFPENRHIYSPGEYLDPPGTGDAEWDLLRFPSEDKVLSGARLAPGRMTGYVAGAGVADVTIHFDEKDTAAKDVDGWRMSDGPPDPLPTAGARAPANPGRAASAGVGRPDMVSIISSPASIDRIQPFAISLWWNPGDSLEQGVIFDMGITEVEDRIVLHFDGRALHYQVFDATLPVSDTSNEDPIGTIEYAFDDGLPLEADTWYHLTAFCRGNRSGQMALFVDGRPRGKRFFYTRLTSGLGQGTSTSGGGVSDNSVRVEDASSFPARGVVKVGGCEIVEYTEKRGDSLYLQPTDNDLFGGRVARGTNFLRNNQLQHPATASVELYGYSAILSSDRIPTGDQRLGEELGEFYVAQIDYREAKDDIVLPGFGEAVGKGFEAGVEEFSLLTLGGDAKVPESAFSKNGGFALLVSYAARNRQYTEQGGGTIGGGPRTENLQRTASGSIINGLEVIRYGSFDGKKLLSVQRGGMVKGKLPNLAGSELEESHAFMVLARDYQYPMPVLVVPMSVRIANARISGLFPVPQPKERGNATSPATASEIAQIDLDFENPSADSTEWVRYNSIIEDQLVRDDVDSAHEVLFWASATRNLNGTAFNQNCPILDVGVNPKNYQNEDRLEDFFNEVNFEDWGNPDNLNRHAFRGVLGTVNCSHTAAARVLPVFRCYRSGREENQARPGRYDDVTIIEESGQRKELAQVNYGWSRSGAEDWNNGYSHVGLRHGVEKEFERSRFLPAQKEDPLDIAAREIHRNDSRGFTRLIKFPSGELPSQAGDRIYLGRDLTGQGQSKGILDEVRVMRAGDPNENLPFAMLVLEDDVEEKEEEGIDLREWSLIYPAWQNHDELTGVAFEPQAQIPRDAYLLQVGDEVIACREWRDGDPVNCVIADNGRGVLGTEPGFHRADEPCMVLPWVVMSRLEDSFSERDSLVRLHDATGFPSSGFVLIDQEVIGYSHVEGTTGGTLYVPTTLHSKTGVSGDVGEPAFRGRYGTLPRSHNPEALVYWLPHRYPDWYCEQTDIPELAALELTVPARRAFFHSLTWAQEGGDEKTRLLAQVRVQGRGHFAAIDGTDPDFFVFDEPTENNAPRIIDRQGDLLQMRFLVRYENDAFDPFDFNRNSWKRAPFLRIANVEYVADRVIEAYEEGQ